MSRTIHGLVFILAALSGLASGPASAALVRVELTGVVEEIGGTVYTPGMPPTSLSPAEAEAALGGSIHVGTTFSAFFVYDDSISPSDGYGEGPAQAWALYFPPGGTTAHGEIGGFTGDGGVGSIDLWDNELYLDGASPSAAFVTTGFFPTVPDGVMGLTGMWLTVQGDGAGSPLHGVGLQQSIPWSLESFPTASVQWIFDDGGIPMLEGGIVIGLRGSVTHLAPEPAGLGVVTLAAVVLLAAWRSRSRRPRVDT